MNTQKAPIWKQLLGAVGGGALGLALYTGYGYAQPVVQGWLTVPETTNHQAAGEDVRIASENVEEDQQKRIAARAREIAEEFTEKTDRYVVEDSAAFTDTAAEAAAVSSASSISVPASEPAQPVAPPTSIVDPDMWGNGLAPVAAADVAPHEGAPLLPSSGFGASAALFAAAGGVYGMRRRGMIQRLLRRAYTV